MDPDFAEAHNNLAVALRETGEDESAQEHLEQALAVNPTYADAHQNLGAYILSLTDRFAGCRGPVLVAMRSPKSGFSGHGPLCYVRTD